MTDRNSGVIKQRADAASWYNGAFKLGTLLKKQIDRCCNNAEFLIFRCFVKTEPVAGSAVGKAVS
ncbi:MAG TPA: hypothetical protein PLD51_05795 [Pontiellaceae bacterium]|nr:hypothetical protein [Pontiellaceae bacterium]HPR83355.1 hypothetical protein [Pontiellaceae bacterium]